MPRSRSVLLVLALLVVSGTARAEDMPRQLNGDLIRTEHEYCKTSTGYGQKFVVQRDVDGDGRRDVVLDYSEALCGGQHEPYCDAGGCLLKVFLGAGGGHRKAFEGRVRSWAVDDRGGRARLLVDGRPLAY
ncbi:MAG: hypothetical protein OEL76_15715 [Siculibacillus sp.]|nr:hypothetical protein [Siculibacillus sp.]